MRSPLTIFGFCVALAGCAAETERQSLGYGDYVALRSAWPRDREFDARRRGSQPRRSGKAGHREAAAWSGQTGVRRQAVLESIGSISPTAPRTVAPRCVCSAPCS